MMLLVDNFDGTTLKPWWTGDGTESVASGRCWWYSTQGTVYTACPRGGFNFQLEMDNGASYSGRMWLHLVDTVGGNEFIMCHWFSIDQTEEHCYVYANGNLIANMHPWGDPYYKIELKAPYAYFWTSPNGVDHWTQVASNNTVAHTFNRISITRQRYPSGYDDAYIDNFKMWNDMSGAVVF